MHLLSNTLTSAFWAVAFFILVPAAPAHADIANTCDWKRDCIEREILQHTDDVYSRLVWSSTLGLQIDGLVQAAIAGAQDNGFQTNAAIVRYLFEQGRTRDALELSIAGRQPARSGGGFVYPGLLESDRVADLSDVSPALPVILLAIHKEAVSLRMLDPLPKSDIEALIARLADASGDGRQDQQRLRELRHVSRYGFWDEFAKYVLPIAPTLTSSAVWHAEGFGDTPRALFLASVDAHMKKTGVIPADHDSRLSDPLRRIFRSGAHPICFTEQEIVDFLTDSKWPDFAEPRDTCLDFFSDFPVFDGSGFLELFIETRVETPQRDRALDVFRDVALAQPKERDIGSILIDMLFQLEGPNGARVQQLVTHFYEDEMAVRAENIRLAGASKQASYIDDLIAWSKEPNEAVDPRIVNRPWYFIYYPSAGPFGVRQSDAFAFYDDILTAFPKNEADLIEFFFVLFSRGVDWNDPNATTLMTSLGQKHNVDWSVVLKAKPTTMLLTALNPNRTSALRFILDAAILDENGRYRPLDKLDQGYAYSILKAMWDAGFCDSFHMNASDPRVIEELEISQRGYDHFALHQLFKSDAPGCWK